MALITFSMQKSYGVADDFAPTMELRKLIPAVNYSLGIESIPLLVLQVTYLKCGGVSLGVRMQHYVVDGLSVMHFIKTWSEMACGINLAVLPLFIDRTILRARDPPQPAFEHVKYKPPPPMKSSSLQAQSNETCMCKARGLPDDQETKLYIATDERTRFQPNLPAGYFGNVVFTTIPIAVAGEIQSNPSCWSRLPIHDADFGWGRPIFMGPGGLVVEAGKMKILVGESKMVIPAMEKPRTNIWNLNIDLIASNIHTPRVYFYLSNSADNFFDAKVLKDALSRALVSFYPLGGKLKEDESVCIEIDCQGQGALFVEAESNGVVDDFNDFQPTMELYKLIPAVNYSLEIEYIPLLVLQDDEFKGVDEDDDDGDD
nr:shikimate O-hydroxycinnamoyltransferase-like [Tanacetum cinerariifolium]